MALTGLRADASARSLTHPARTSDLLGAWSLRGLRLGQDVFDVHVGADGSVTVDLPAGSPIDVRVT